MKKLLAVILILAMLLPAAATALEREVDYYYGYGHIEVTKSGTPFIAVIYFAEDQTCYYLAQMFKSDEPGLGRAYVGTWGYTADGKVFAKIGENTSATFSISSLGSIIDTETMDVYEKFDALMK